MKSKKNVLEWIVFGASLAIVGTLVVYLAVQSVRQNETPPDIRIATGTPRQSSGGWMVPLVVHNAGEQTAEEVKIEVTLEANGRPIESADLMVAFLPHRSRREGWVVFRNDPARYQIRARAVGFEKP